jgi:hypothetical protein
MQQCVEIDYTNWGSERRLRVIHPFEWAWTSSEWHTEPGWMVHATDIEDGKAKWFALSGVHAWRDLPARTKNQIPDRAACCG